MKPSTKRVLNVIFCFGVITAAMSIGRAATITKHNLETDSSCKSPYELAEICYLMALRAKSPEPMVRHDRRNFWYRICLRTGIATTI